MRFDFFYLLKFFLLSEVLLSIKSVKESILNTKSESMIASTIKIFSCHDLKLESFSIGIELMLAVILATKSNKQIKQAHTSLKIKINSNKGKPIPRYRTLY